MKVKRTSVSRPKGLLKNKKLQLISRPTSKVSRHKDKTTLNIGGISNKFGISKQSDVVGLVNFPRSLEVGLDTQENNLNIEDNGNKENGDSLKHNKLLRDTRTSFRPICNKQLLQLKPTLKIEHNKKKNRSNSDRKNGNRSDEIQLGLGLDPNKVSEAVSSLLTVLLKKKSDNKNIILDLAETVYMQVECIKIPICPTKQLRFKIPHPIVKDTSDILLIVPDKKGSKIYPEKAIDHYSELLAKHDINFIQKIMPLRMLKQEYYQYEMRRKLVDQFDLILVDAPVSKCLPKVLGKLICYKHKMPITVHLDRKDLKEHLKTAVCKTQMTVKSNGHTSVVKVGDTKMSEEEIASNIVAVSKELAKSFPGGWQNIRSLNIKGATSVSLPVHLSLVSPNNIRIPVETRKMREAVEGELSTMPGMNVIVRADGTVILKKVEEGEPSDDNNDDEILLEAEKYIQSSKTVRYSESDDEKDADVITAAVEQDLLNNYNKSINKQDEDDEEEEEEDEGSDENEPLQLIPITSKKRKFGHDKKVSIDKPSGNKKQKKTHQQGKTKGSKQNSEGGMKRRGSRGGKKYKMSKDQKKAQLKRNKAMKN